MLDTSAITLIGVNIFQMVFILVLVFPLFKLELIATYITNFKISFQTNYLFRSSCVFYCVFIALFGIIAPIRTLNEYGSAKDEETSREKLLRIIQITNATRNYILGGFSLFFLLVGLRLFDFVIFSAKLQEFSVLMSNYQLIDITFSEIEEKESSNLYVGDTHDDSSDTIDKSTHEISHWPSFINLRKLERAKIRKFLQSLDSDAVSDSKSSKKSSIEKILSSNAIEIHSKEEVRKSLSRTLLHENLHVKELDDNKERTKNSIERLKNFEERLAAGIERVKAWKGRTYDDKEHSRKKHVEVTKKNDIADSSEATTSAPVESPSQGTIKSEDIPKNDHKIKKTKTSKKDIFRFR